MVCEMLLSPECHSNNILYHLVELIVGIFLDEIGYPFLKILRIVLKKPTRKTFNSTLESQSNSPQLLCYSNDLHLLWYMFASWDDARLPHYYKDIQGVPLSQENNICLYILVSLLLGRKIEKIMIVAFTQFCKCFERGIQQKISQSHGKG